MTPGWPSWADRLLGRWELWVQYVAYLSVGQGRAARKVRRERVIRRCWTRAGAEREKRRYEADPTILMAVMDNVRAGRGEVWPEFEVRRG